MFGMKDDEESTAATDRVHHKFGDLGQSNSREPRLSGTSPSKGDAAHDPPERREHRPLSKHDKKDSAEESRLFGDSSSSRPDPHAVAIRPRPSTSRTKALESFKPKDTLAARTDAPQTSLNDSNNNDNRTATKTRSAHFGLSGSAADGVRPASFHENDTERPRKRQKVNVAPNVMTDVIEIEDDDAKPREPNTPSSSKLTSPVSHKLQRPSSFGHHKSKAQKHPPKTNEFWNVEKAIKPRSSQLKKKESSVVRLIDADEPWDGEVRSGTSREAWNEGKCGGSQVMTAVEIPTTPRKADAGKDAAIDPKPDGSPTNPDGRQRHSNDLRESPDALQGDRTVRDLWRLQAEKDKRGSPNDIRPTQFSSGVSRNSKSDGRRRRHRNKKQQLKYPIQLFRFETTITQQPLHIIIDRENANFTVAPPNGVGDREKINVSRVNSILYSQDTGNTKIRLTFPKSQHSRHTNVDMQFQNHEDSIDFYSVISDMSNTKTFEKTKDWMDKAFENSLMSQGSEAVSGHKRENVPELRADATTRAPSPKHKRQRLSDNLQNGDISVHDSTSGPDRSKAERPSDILSHAHPAKQSSDGSIPIPVRTYSGPYLTKRETRSQTKQQGFPLDNDNGTSFSTTLPSVIRNAKWTTPLVYPKTGKKKAEVEKHDLERLNDAEFLNDNLIGFYVRFLEYHLERTNPDVAKRVYFFNSYFFASLTNTPRGEKGINYQAVEKWTRAVDIFSYDYIVVPINESAHWYMALICNMPHLIHLLENEEKAGDSHEDADKPKELHTDEESGPTKASNVSEGPEAAGDGRSEPQPENGKGDGLPQSLHDMTLSDRAPTASPHHSRNEFPPVAQSGHSDKEDWPDEDENLPSSKPTPPRPNYGTAIKGPQEQTELGSKSESLGPSKKRGNKKSRQPPIQTYDLDQPIIVAFDSLGCRRSPTMSALRDYLVQEAKSKKSLTFDGKRIKGMNAPQIPLQPNYSDCGLYLLAYLEKFVRAPDEFAGKLLAKTMKQHIDWPRLRSGELRRRLLRFLLDLYQEQNVDKGKKHDSGVLIVDTTPLHILLRDEEPTENNSQTPRLSPEAHASTPRLQSSRPSTPKQTDTDKSEKGERHKRPATPVRSSPRLTRAEPPEKQQQQPTSPVVAIEKYRVPVKGEDGDDLLSQLQSAATQEDPDPSRQQAEPFVAETPPPEAQDVTETEAPQVPSATSPSRRPKRSRVSI